MPFATSRTAPWPDAFPGRGRAAYLDTASIGLVPTQAGAAAARCYEALGAGVRGMARTRAAVERTRTLLAEEFGCTAQDIVFASSTGEAVNAVARAISWQQGDEVLTLDDEFPTVSQPWSKLPGVRLVTVPAGPDDDRTSALMRAIGPHTRLVAVSHVSSHTGTAVDLAALGAACTSAGALLLCDGAQAAGVLPVVSAQADFYVATGYKWMLAGFGIAFLIIKAPVRDTLEPTLLGHANIPPSRNLAVGTPNLAGIHALGAAAELRRTVGHQAITERATALAARIRDEAQALGFRPVGHSGHVSQIVSLVPPGLPAESWVTRLEGTDVIVAERGGNLRISPHFYTADSDVDALLLALSHPHA
ncbi:aminotransferase class V-fold PLP-dependent enzyme [Streptomyces mirabilis]|uniref:aminotransferase class V-fold PLP-dependent enzyme n=1 Tax=Streptomyces mirabilis TaxID=68239 RepID=UPI002E2B7E47|nr:aminotransferase class V-fold PLP-dependent enzyme [Streptomyces mirabilis]